MKRALAALVAIAATMAAMPVAAEATIHERWVGTRCMNGKVFVHRYVDGHQLTSPFSCPVWTEARIVSGSVKYYTWRRPELDLNTANYYAQSWWGHCRVEWSGVDASQFNPNNSASWYLTRFRLDCP